MQLVLFTGDDCGVCHAVEEKFRARFKVEIDNDEADIVNLDAEEDAQQFWAENELPLAPCIIVVSDSKKVISVLDAAQLLDEAEPAARGGG